MFGAPGIVTSNAIVIPGGQEIQFSMEKPIKKIRVEDQDRTFKVSFDSVSDDTKDGVESFNYVFAVTED
jgi:hypothetical protein